MIVNRAGREGPGSPSEPLVEVTRGDLVEAVHRGVVALVDASGALRAAAGDPKRVQTYWRSSAKPFQAMPVVYSGAAARWSLSSADLAIIAASHSGEPVHVSHVASLLGRIGLGPDDLLCGVHPPLRPEATAELHALRVEPSTLHNNCSGKHTGMLALAEQLGAGTLGYTSSSHPVQREVLATVCRFTGLPTEAVTLAVDGCGVPCFGTSVYHLALAFARLMDPASVGEPYAAAAGAVREAMIEHPHLVAGTGRFDTDLMRAAGGTMLSKGGASGVQCVGLPGGVGLAVKIEDGSDSPSIRPSGVVAIEALRQLGMLDADQVAALDRHARPSVWTIAGDRVGEVRPTFTLTPCTESPMNSAA